MSMNLNKKYPLIGGSICAVVLLVLASFGNVVGYHTVQTNSVKVSQDTEHVELSVSPCNLHGFKTRHVNLTKSEYNKLDFSLTSLQNELDNATSMAEARSIVFKQIDVLSKYHLLPRGLTSTQAKKLLYIAENIKQRSLSREKKLVKENYQCYLSLKMTAPEGFIPRYFFVNLFYNWAYPPPIVYDILFLAMLPIGLYIYTCIVYVGNGTINSFGQGGHYSHTYGYPGLDIILCAYFWGFKITGIPYYATTGRGYLIGFAGQLWDAI